jgi:hypothetical protein
VQTFYRLRSIPGVGNVLALVLLYELHDTRRFASAGLVHGPVTPTLISRLVQPGCCNRNEKRVAWSKGRGQGTPMVTTKRREKSSPWRLHTLTSEAI